MKMEVDPGPFLDLIEGPPHEIRLPAVGDIENKAVLLRLPADNRQDCHVEGEDPNPISLPAN